jgi:hypothetical protein
MLAGCKINHDAEPVLLSYKDFDKYKIRSVTSYTWHVYEYQEKKYLKMVDSAFYQPTQRSITSYIHYLAPGCFEHDSKHIEYFDSTYLCYLKVYKNEKDEINGVEFLDAHPNEFIDSCLRLPHISYTRIINLPDKKIIVTKAKKNLDSTIIYLKKGRPQTKIAYTGSINHKNYKSDTTYYTYPQPGLQVIQQAEIIDSIFICGNKKKEIRYDTDYGRKFSFVSTYRAGTLIKSVYKSWRIKDVHLYTYHTNQLTEDKHFRNDTLLRKVVYEYNNRLLQHIYTYNYRCTTSTQQLTVNGYEKFGTDSLPKLKGYSRDSVYYNYQISPNITTYYYTFY